MTSDDGAELVGCGCVTLLAVSMAAMLGMAVAFGFALAERLLA